jgi:hypothetical protein
LRIFNVCNPSNIEYIGVRSFSQTTDVDVEGDIAFVANGNTGFAILNVSDPSLFALSVPAPYVDISITGGDGSLGNITALWKQGPHLYVANYREFGGGCFTYDIRDLTNPRLMSSAAVYKSYEIAVDGDIAFVNHDSVLRAYNLTPPNNTQYLTGFGWMGNVTGIWTDGTYVVVSMGHEHLILVDASNSSDLESVDWQDEPSLRGVFIHGENVYCAAEDHVSVYSIYKGACRSFFEGLSVAQ